MATFGPSNRTRANNSQRTQTVTNGGLALLSEGKGAKAALGDVITVGKRGQLSIANTTTINGATQDQLNNVIGQTAQAIAGAIGSAPGSGGGGAASYLVPTSSGSGALKWIAIGGAALVVIVLLFFRKR